MSMPNANLDSLEFLDLHDNNITRSLPLYLAELPSLRIVSLRGNSVVGSIPVPLSKLQRLHFLDLSCNHLQDRFQASSEAFLTYSSPKTTKSYYNVFFASDSASTITST
ncbi:hypothetical protein HPP92_013996 [Vanilla planifolia]|uniref:Uncharacterized protein n=1 Tax=Vanilla planifolia TaxID=51239 RepID=A0A835QPG4_VANPL|nr:hypothetical protein HPP92_013996 [Vanilla planifolia]